MCTTCGCSDNAKATITDLDSGETVNLGHDHAHDHHHDHHHPHDHHHHHDHDDDHGHDGTDNQEVTA